MVDALNVLPVQLPMYQLTCAWQVVQVALPFAWKPVVPEKVCCPVLDAQRSQAPDWVEFTMIW